MKSIKGRLAFSLVEVLISLAILSVVGFVVAKFVIGSKFSSATLSDSSACLNLVQSFQSQLGSDGGRLEIAEPFFPVSGDRVGASIVPPPSHAQWGLSSINPTSQEIIGTTNNPVLVANNLLIFGTANLVQAILNSDPTNICSDDETVFGKDFTELMDWSTLSEDMTDGKLYLKIQPFDLPTQTPRPCGAGPYFARPIRSANQPVQLRGPRVSLLGDTTLGFKTTLTLEFTSSGKRKFCQSSASYQHQGDTARPVSLPPPVSVSTADGAPLPDESPTFCNQTGPRFNTIDVTLNFANAEKGSTFLCRGAAGTGSNIPITSFWTSCDVVTFGSHQAGPTTSSWDGREVTLRFEQLTPDRRFDFEYVAVDTAGNFSNISSIYFYIDATRPSISQLTASNVGRPTDRREGRNYEGPSADWILPPANRRFTDGGWLQCNSNSVTITAVPSDILNVDLGCFGEATNSLGQTIGSTTNCRLTTRGGLGNSENYVTFTATDFCGSENNRHATWHVDLPSTFDATDPTSPPSPFSNDNSTQEDTDGEFYEITIPFPALPINQNPKHFVTECDCNVLNLDDNDLTCATLVDPGKYGCTPTPNNFRAQVYHVCGGPPQLVQTQYEVLGDAGDPCTTQSCKSGLVCCDSTNPDDCPDFGFGKCQSLTNYSSPTCTSPVVGRPQGPTSGCNPAAPLGLFDCGYNSRCIPTETFLSDVTDCPSGAKTGDACTSLWHRFGECDSSGTGKCCFPDSASTNCISATAGPGNSACLLAGDVGLRCQGQTTGTCGPMVPMTPECTPRARTPSGTRPGHPANEVCPTRTFPGCMSSISTTTVTTTTVTTAASVTTTTLGGCLNPGEYPDSASCETAAVAETDYCVAPTAPSVCYNLVRCPTGSYTISSGECPRLIFEAEHQACIPSGSQPLCERYKDCGSDYIEESVCNSACSPTSCTLRGNGCFRCPSATTTTVTNTTNTTYCLPSGHLVLQYQCTESCADEYGRSRCWCSTYGEGPCPYNGPEPAMPTPGCCSGRLRGYDINMGVKLDWEKLRMILGIENAYATCNFAPPMHPIHYTVKWECE